MQLRALERMTPGPSHYFETIWTSGRDKFAVEVEILRLEDKPRNGRLSLLLYSHLPAESG
jgi:hypothetical protein